DARIHPSAPPVKSVTFTREMAVLALHGTGLGFQPGILAGATSALSRRGINIKSVLTSQTCISLLLHPDDLNAASLLIEREAIAGVDHIEPENGLALVALVGEGISERCGIVGRTFSAVARCGINVRLVCAGASRAALYFITARRDCERAVGAVHGEFWGDEK
ncbi:MAG: ACT domain-containing protein, partial [Bacillota bacterium]